MGITINILSVSITIFEECKKRKGKKKGLLCLDLIENKTEWQEILILDWGVYACWNMLQCIYCICVHFLVGIIREPVV